MAPRRKKSRQNSQAPTTLLPATDLTTRAQKEQEPATSNSHPRDQKGTGKLCTPANNQPSGDRADKAAARSSWYGSWSSKASPVAQVARESVSVAGGATTESSAHKAPPGKLMHNSLRRASKSFPLVAEPSKINATGSNTEIGRAKDKGILEQDVSRDRGIHNQDMAPLKEQVVTPNPISVQAIPEPPLPPDPGKDGTVQGDKISQQAAANASWLGGWWSRPDGYFYTGEVEKAKENGKLPEENTTQPQETPLPLSPSVTRDSEAGNLIKQAQDGSSDTNGRIEHGSEIGGTQTDTLQVAKTADAASTRSWFGLWSTSQYQEAQDNQPATDGQPSVQVQKAPENDTSTNPPVANAAQNSNQAALSDTGPKSAKEEPVRPISSGWAFWSTDKQSEQPTAGDGTQKRVGELAVADTPSQSHPEAAQFNEQQEARTKSKEQPKVAAGKDVKTLKVPNAQGVAASVSPSPLPTRPTTPESGKSAQAKASGTSTPTTSKPQQIRPNLIIPSFDVCYSLANVPSYWDRLTQYVAASLKIIDKPAASEHVFISPTLPKIRTAIAIGVHGYFPALLVQKVLGQPTGTSIRFANYASQAIRTWTEKNQPDLPCDIETVALEGEGFIADRVSTLWKLMLNWLSHLQKADLILVACHSQGVPVAIMLVSKLIELGCLSPTARVGVCAMAGVNLGPFVEYQSRMWGATAGELFDFSRPESRVSKEYASAVEVVLRHGVRVTYIGSLDDQLVSLESSLFTNLTHPYIQRAVFVDGRIHAPDFITHLVAFALRLRNLGISDHGLIRELSHPLAGSIYGGEGHSRVYNDEAVYELALSFTLETTDVDARASSNTKAGAATNSPAKEIEKDQRAASDQRRGSISGTPLSTSAAANSVRRASVSGSASLPGIAPVIAPYEVPATGAAANPYFLPWALRGILEEELVKRDLQDEVKELVGLFEEWRPQSKPLKDVKFRLEAVKSTIV